VEAPDRLDMDRLRREFALRLQGLTPYLKDEKNLAKISLETGISSRQLSQWRNRRHINWPSVPALIRLCDALDISPTWLLLGVGPMKLSMLRNQNGEGKPRRP
jgi:transcriptional regulator with XRE-family HTH domain